MSVNPIGMVFELSPSDKLPTTALKTTFGGGGAGNNQIRTLLLIGACASGGGTLTADTQIADVIAEGERRKPRLRAQGRPLPAPRLADAERGARALPAASSAFRRS